MGDRNRGVYHKFRVSRVDGSDAQGGRHEGCQYFVLDCDHDPHAKAALNAYANSCRAEYPTLARDLDGWVRQLDFGRFPWKHCADVCHEREYCCHPDDCKTGKGVDA